VYTPLGRHLLIIKTSSYPVKLGLGDKVKVRKKSRY
jgi:hypothetical protein